MIIHNQRQYYYYSTVVDNRRTPHPYKSKYPDTWEKELAGDLTKHGAIYIAELAEHMVLAASQKVIVVTEHEDD